MFWTMEKLQNFAVENGITLDLALRSNEFAHLITGILIHKIFVDYSKLAPVKKFFENLRKYIKK